MDRRTRIRSYPAHLRAIILSLFFLLAREQFPGRISWPSNNRTDFKMTDSLTLSEPNLVPGCKSSLSLFSESLPDRDFSVTYLIAWEIVNYVVL